MRKVTLTLAVFAVSAFFLIAAPAVRADEAGGMRPPPCLGLGCADCVRREDCGWCANPRKGAYAGECVHGTAVLPMENSGSRCLEHPGLYYFSSCPSRNAVLLRRGRQTSGASVDLGAADRGGPSVLMPHLERIEQLLGAAVAGGDAPVESREERSVENSDDVLVVVDKVKEEAYRRAATLLAGGKVEDVNETLSSNGTSSSSSSSKSSSDVSGSVKLF